MNRRAQIAAALLGRALMDPEVWAASQSNTTNPEMRRLDSYPGHSSLAIQAVYGQHSKAPLYYTSGDPEAAARLQAERRAKKAAAWAKRQPKGKS